MTKRGRAPGAAPYNQMPGYGASLDLCRELLTIAARIGPDPYRITNLMKEKAITVLTAAGEAGARIGPGRRAVFYRAGWFTTWDCNALLKAARELKLYPAEAMLSADAVLRMAQQILTLAAAAMERRAGGEEVFGEADGDPGYL